MTTPEATRGAVAFAVSKRRRSPLGLPPLSGGAGGGSANLGYQRNVRPNIGRGLGSENGQTGELGGGAGKVAAALIRYGGGNKVSAAKKPSPPVAKPSTTTSPSQKSKKLSSSPSSNEPAKPSSSSLLSTSLKSAAIKPSAPGKTKVASSTPCELTSDGATASPSSALSPKAKKRVRTRKDDHWMDMLSQLRAYKTENGDCVVPRGYAFNTKLASWVAEQRKQFKLKECGKPSNITPERISLLDAMGFVWNAQEAAWARHFEDLKKYKNQYGDCMVPLSFTDYPRLGLWVKEQRRHYALLNLGKHSHMTLERVARLESISFTWDSHEAMWWERFRELCQYREYFGDCLVPTKYSANLKLGTWVHHQRRQYRMLQESQPSHMTQRRLRALEDIGFNWAPRANQDKGGSAAPSYCADGTQKREEEEGEESIGSVPSKESDSDENEELVEVSRAHSRLKQAGTKAQAA